MAGNATRLLNISAVENLQNGYSPLMVDTAEHHTTFSGEYTANQTSLTIITPTSGHKICVQEVYVAVNANSGTISLDFATSEKKVFRMYAAKQQTWAIAGVHIEGATDEALQLTSTVGENEHYLIINYIEEE